jgi:hypothetical protein
VYFTVPGIIDEPSFVYLVIYPDQKISDLEMANMQYNLELKCREFKDINCTRGLATSIPHPDLDENAMRDRLTKVFEQYGWHLAGLAIVKIPTQK